MKDGKPVDLIRGPLSKLELLGKLGDLIPEEESNGASDASDGLEEAPQE